MTEKNPSGQKIWVKIVDIIYGLGVLIIIYHLGRALFVGNVVPYPDAMLPSSYWEIALFRLAIGAIPMTFASIFFWRGNHPGSSGSRKRNLVLTFLPAVICLLCLAFYVVLTIYAMVSFTFSRGMSMM